MRLNDTERAENREAFARMDLKQKLAYIFAYYKFPLVLLLIAVVALGSVLYYKLGSREALLYVACANISSSETLDDALCDGYMRAIGADPRKSEVKLYRSLYLTRDATIRDHEYAYASQLKVMSAMTKGQLDVLLMNREAYDIMSSRGYLLPLEEFLSGDLYGRVSDQMCENTVILSENEIEHLLDESVPYEAVTEEVVNGIILSDFPLFSRAELSGDVYLGVVGNSARRDAALEYIDYLTSAPQSETA